MSDIFEGPEGSHPESLYATDTALFFSANNASTGKELWTLTDVEPELVADINKGAIGSSPFGFVEHDGWVYFTGRTEAEGSEVWRTDGDVAELITDIWAGPDSSRPQELISYKDQLCLAATNQELGRELYCYLTADLIPIRRVED